MQKHIAENLEASLKLIKQGASQADILDWVTMNLWIMETEFGISELMPLNQTEIIRQTSKGDLDSYFVTDDFVLALSENKEARVWDKIYTDGVVDSGVREPQGHLYIGDNETSKGCAFRLRDASYVLWASYSVNGTEKLERSKRKLYTNDLSLDVNRLPNFDYTSPTFEFTDEVEKEFLEARKNCHNNTKHSFDLNMPQAIGERPQVFCKKQK